MVAVTADTDIRDLVARALEQTAAIIAAIPADAAGAPTPCPDWDVRALLPGFPRTLRWRIGPVRSSRYPRQYQILRVGRKLRGNRSDLPLEPSPGHLIPLMPE
jgi:Mycothiol maleylpyruvate isomerase N-terminal domain